MTARVRYSAAAVAAALAAAVVYGLVSGGGAPLDDAAPTGCLPRIRPDYAGVTIPPNIAPLNFVVEEPADRYAARLRGPAGDPVEVASGTGAIAIPLGPWRRLLAANRGRELVVEVGTRTARGTWQRFAPFTVRVAEEPIDRYLVYRFIRPIHNNYKTIDICQRDLEGHDVSFVVRNVDMARGCVNCHTFSVKDPSRMFLHVRGPLGAAMILARDGKVVRVDTRTALGGAPAGYASWHPSGRLLAFSMNRLSQLFHTMGENRDVFDAHSDLALYLVDSNTVTTTDAISLPDRNETWPAWSADGRHLYFSAAPKLPQDRFREVRYDLMRIGYDPQAGAWGALETVLAAADTGRSILEPRPSPDGRWLLVAMCEYGNFPIYQPSCDLYLVDPAAGTHRPLECNSPQCDSFHSWSSNSRWIVFSSKRDDGLFARPYFSYLDTDGRARKPFVLPQEDPTYYDSCIRTYNAPELATAPVPASRREFARVIRSPGPDESIKAVLDPRVPPRAEPADAGPEPPWKPAGSPPDPSDRRAGRHDGG